MTISKQVRDIKVGDMVDLEGDAILGGHPETEFEYSIVQEIGIEQDCIVLYFEGMAAGYDPGQIMSVSEDTA